MRFKVANRRDHIFVKWSGVKVSLARATGAANASEVECQDLESVSGQHSRLVAPTFFCKSASMSEYDPASALAIELRRNEPTILRRK
jgi:hypothetical protein